MSSTKISTTFGRVRLGAANPAERDSETITSNMTGPNNPRRPRPNPERGIIAGTVSLQTTLAILADEQFNLEARASRPPLIGSTRKRPPSQETAISVTHL